MTFPLLLSVPLTGLRILPVVARINFLSLEKIVADKVKIKDGACIFYAQKKVYEDLITGDLFDPADVILFAMQKNSVRSLVDANHRSQIIDEMIKKQGNTSPKQVYRQESRTDLGYKSSKKLLQAHPYARYPKQSLIAWRLHGLKKTVHVANPQKLPRITIEIQTHIRIGDECVMKSKQMAISLLGE